MDGEDLPWVYYVLEDSYEAQMAGMVFKMPSIFYLQFAMGFVIDFVG